MSNIFYFKILVEYLFNCYSAQSKASDLFILKLYTFLLVAQTYYVVALYDDNTLVKLIPIEKLIFLTNQV